MVARPLFLLFALALGLSPACSTITGSRRAAPAAGQADGLPRPARTWYITIPRYGLKLDNGIKVLVIPDWSSELVEVGVRLDVGAVHDPEGHEGLAHLVEHLSFLPRLGGTAMPSLGDQLDEIALWHNAFTTLESTHFVAAAPHDRLADLLRIEAHRMLVGCTAIDRGDFEREREVVRNERLQRTAGVRGPLQQALVELAYPRGHPYRRPPGGTDASIAGSTFEDACGFLRQHYHAGNVTVVVTGRVVKQQLVAALEESLERVPARPPSERPAPTPPAAPNAHRVETLEVESPTLYVLWPLPARHSDEGLLAELLLTMLGADVLERLQRHGISDDVGVSTLGGLRAPTGVLAIALDRADDEGAARREIAAAVDRARTMKDDVASSLGVNGFLALYQRLEPLAGRSQLFADYLQFDPSQRMVTGDLERVFDADAETLRSLAGRLFDLRNANTLIVEPGDGRARAPARAPLGVTATIDHSRRRWRGLSVAEPAATDAPAALRSPLDRLRQLTLDNGLEVIIVPHSWLPLAEISLVIRSGWAQDGDAPGASELAAFQLGVEAASVEDETETGTGTEKPKDSRNQRNRKKSREPIRSPGEGGGRLRRRVRADATIFTIRGPAHLIDLQLEGTAHWIREASFEAAAVEQARRSRRRELARAATRDGARAARQLATSLFGADHPSATALHPPPSTVDQLTLARLEGYRRQHYRPGNAVLIVSGRFNPDLVEAHVRHWFGAWQAAGDERQEDLPGARSPRGGAPASRPRYLAVPSTRPSAAVEVVLAYPVVDGHDQDYATRLVLREVLDERLRSLRTELGATYGFSVDLVEQTGGGFWLIEGSVDASRSAEALGHLAAELAELRLGAELEQEVRFARRRLARQRTAQRSLLDAARADLVTASIYRLPPALFRDLPSALGAVDPDKVRRLIDAELSERQTVMVLGGDRDAVRAAYAAMGIDTFEVVD